MRRVIEALILTAAAMLFASPLRGQSRATKCDPSLRIAQMQHTPPKGRLQDAGAPQTVHIIQLGPAAIPKLIACLTDTTETKEPIEDFWAVTTVGDIAFFYLCDLFTDSTWEHSTIDGVVNWDRLNAENPSSSASKAWYEFLKRHGRKYVQESWYKKWRGVQSAIFWDAKEQCFRVSSAVTQIQILATDNRESL